MVQWRVCGGEVIVGTWEGLVLVGGGEAMGDSGGMMVWRVRTAIWWSYGRWVVLWGDVVELQWCFDGGVVWVWVWWLMPVEC
ncbi:hypothetical protein U1Q18_040031 [Sarracenia purpurea var. burkii]